MSPQLSILICTHNRVQYLRKALQSLREQTLSSDQFEIILIDNCSTDGTDQLVKYEFKDLANLKYTFEPILGLSSARNRGWLTAQGEFVAYMDDDAVAGADWAQVILDTFNTVIPQPGVICGKVVPIWEIYPPEWLSQDLWGLFSVFDWAPEPKVFTGNYFCGTNMAFRRQLLAQIGGFDIHLGRKGKKLISNEEIYVQEQIKAIGQIIYYHPAIVVNHYVPAYRITKQWLAQRIYWQGFSDAQMLLLQSKSQLLATRFYLAARGLKGLVTALKRAPTSQLLNRDRDTISFMRQFYFNLGFLMGAQSGQCLRENEINLRLQQDV